MKQSKQAEKSDCKIEIQIQIKKKVNKGVYKVYNGYLKNISYGSLHSNSCNLQYVCILCFSTLCFVVMR
jgi:hypothetical protein